MTATKVKVGQLENEILSGWYLVNESWSYASATTITVPTNAGNRFQKGDKIRLKQGAGYKYFYIIGVAATTLTVIGGTDYSVANAGITDIYISRELHPFGFPQFLRYSPAAVGLTNPSYNNQSGFFNINGGLLYIYFLCDIASWSAQASYIRITAPFNTESVGYGAGQYYRAGGSTEDGSVTIGIYSNNIVFGNSLSTDWINWEASARIVVDGSVIIVGY